MERVALSLDFDFFARDPGKGVFPAHEHSYGVIHDWFAAYGKADLYAESDIDRHADFAPARLWAALGSRGLVPGKGLRCAVSESHALAWDWLDKDRAKFDAIVHIDAHHDCFKLDASKQTKKWFWPYRKISARAHRAGVHCGNWLTVCRPEVPAISLYPHWKDRNLDGRPQRPNLRMYRWKDWRPAPASRVITTMIVSRSGPWVPPHLDGHFVDLLDDVRRFARLEPLEEVMLRSEWAPSRKDAKWLFAHSEGRMGRLRAL